MKEYTYYGDLEKDIKKSKQKFSLKKFFVHFCITIISICLTLGICSLIGIVPASGFIAGWFRGFTVVDIYKASKETKTDSEHAMHNLTNLYRDINLNCVNRDLCESRMKECISVQKKQKIINNTDTKNIILSDEEKIATYFYLLDSQEKLQILRQVKDDIKNNKNVVYLLEDEDIKIENIEIPVEKTLRLKKKN